MGKYTVCKNYTCPSCSLDLSIPEQDYAVSLLHGKCPACRASCKCLGCDGRVVPRSRYCKAHASRDPQAADGLRPAIREIAEAYREKFEEKYVYVGRFTHFGRIFLVVVIVGCAWALAMRAGA